MSDVDRIDGYTTALFEVARAEGSLEEVEDAVLAQDVVRGRQQRPARWPPQDPLEPVPANDERQVRVPLPEPLDLDRPVAGEPLVGPPGEPLDVDEQGVRVVRGHDHFPR